MNKAELISAIAERTEIKKTLIASVLENFQSVVLEEVAAEGSVALVGFGTFGSKATAARQVRNPQTGKTSTKPAGRKTTFKMGKLLKDAAKA